MTNQKPEHFQSRERLLSKDYILVMLACTGTAFCNYFFFTALPLFAIKISGSNVFGGMMVVAYSLAALVIRPISGIISDKFGRVKLLIFGALICAVACFLYGITTSIVLLLAIRVLNGIGFGMHSTSGGAVAADVIPKSRLAEGIGYFGLYATVASAFAPVIALSIVGKGEVRNFQFLFFLAAGICLLSMLFDCLISYERKKKKAVKQKVHNEADSQAVSEVQAHVPPTVILPKTFLGFEYAVFLPVAVLIILFFAQSSINTFLTLFAADRAFGNIGLYFTFVAVGLFLSRILFGKLTDKRGPDIVVIPGIIGIIICMTTIPFIHSPGYLFALGLPFGLANGAVFPSINSLIFKHCSPQRRGTASAAYFAAIDIGFMIGGTVFGIVADNFGYSIVYWSAAVLSAVALLLYLKAVAVKKAVVV